MWNFVDSTGQGCEEKTDKVIVSFYDEETAWEICAARMRTHPRSWLESPPDIGLIGYAFSSKRETACIASTFGAQYNHNDHFTQ